MYYLKPTPVILFNADTKAVLRLPGEMRCSLQKSHLLNFINIFRNQFTFEFQFYLEIIPSYRAILNVTLTMFTETIKSFLKVASCGPHLALMVRVIKCQLIGPNQTKLLDKHKQISLIACKVMTKVFHFTTQLCAI